ncbi:MAG: type II toxin-antitoxin system VapC family toxin [Nitrospirae bacterium]|nr:type II toxin-antitoxin system VapC family toxin [Nitrospirota bacterium]
MLLSEMADDSKVFIDSNIFIYHFSKFEKFADSCLEFFQRIEAGKLSGFTSTLVLAEILHRLMIIEASNKLSLQTKKILEFLKANPEKITLLTDHLASYDLIEKLGVTVLSVNARDIEQSNSFKKECRLFTNDAINLSVMKNSNLIYLASNDPDFERADFITLCKPF